MDALKKFLFATGLLLVCLIIYTEQAAMAIPSSDEQFNLEKRRIDAHARTSIPLFRGSNLGIFVRKRPSPSDNGIVRRQDENYLAELLSSNEHLQRRFDDYSENPGPMFGR